MVCGSFGSPALIPYNKGISFLNALLAVLAVCFGIIGCVSYTNKADAIAAAPWISSWKESNGKAYTDSGVKSFLSYKLDEDKDRKDFVFLDDFLVDMPNPQTYKECLDNMDNWTNILFASGNPTYLKEAAALKVRCEDCDKASVAVITTCSFALIAAAVAFLGQVLRATCDSAFAKNIAFFGGASSFVFGVSSYGTFSKCAMSSRDYATLIGATGSYGIGAKLVAASFSMAVFVTILTVAVPVPELEEKEEDGKMVTRV